MKTLVLERGRVVKYVEDYPTMFKDPWGYFTSEEVGMNILNYDPVPGVYNGCIRLVEVGKIWSL